MRLCIVCGAYGEYAIGIRARDERKANAVWAPNIDTYLCGEHATRGIQIGIVITPREDGRVTTVTTGPRGVVETALVIGSGTKVAPGQEVLL